MTGPDGSETPSPRDEFTPGELCFYILASALAGLAGLLVILW
jgi:hypothetical protein